MHILCQVINIGTQHKQHGRKRLNYGLKCIVVPNNISLYMCQTWYYLKRLATKS